MTSDSATLLRCAEGDAQNVFCRGSRRDGPVAGAWIRCVGIQHLLLTFLLTLLVVTTSGSAQAQTTYYIRTDGGDANQCTGLADESYAGSGVAQACAWKHPFHALSPDGTKRIAGGDTLIIGSGSYMMGQGAPGADGCAARTCYMPPIPSGPTPTTRTRILGKSGVAPPKLWGTESVSRVLNLDGSSNVEIGGLEITDRSDCVDGHSNSSAACKNTAPYGTWASFGIYARASSNVWLHDVHVHGMARVGLLAGGLTNWTLDRARFNTNGRAGWSTNIGTGSSNSGQIILRNVEFGWNGCGERWETGEPWACWAEQTGGYGDGLGTTYTSGQWLIEDAFVHHNTSDGLDLRFMDGAPATRVTIHRAYAKANAGNQIKVRGSSTIENSVLISACAYFKGKYFMGDADICRAAGNTLQLVMTPNAVVTVRHNTITGEGGNQIGTGEGDGTGTIHLQNNVVVGQPRWDNPAVLSGLQYGTFTGSIIWSGNLIWKVRNGTCPADSICGQDPQLADMALQNFDGEALAISPAIDSAPMIAEVDRDFLLQPRPFGPANDIGAYELQIAPPPPPPVCTRATPTIALAGPTTAVAAGSTVEYTVSLQNNDSNACTTTSFNLARTVPSGWTGTLAASSLDLAPGASGSTTLNVTSAANATEGSYGIGAGTSSNVGAVHTASDSNTYIVAAPAPVCTRATPTIALAGPTTAVAAGSTVEYTVSLQNNDSNACSTTSFNLARTVPSGWTGTLAASSLALAPGASGSTTLIVTSAANATEGSYGIGAGIGSNVGTIHTASDSSTYLIAAAAVSLDTEVGTDKITYALGETVRIHAFVRNNGSPVIGASVRFTVTRANGGTTTLRATSGSDGYARATYKITKAKSALGTYTVMGTWSQDNVNSSNSTVFEVR